MSKNCKTEKKDRNYLLLDTSNATAIKQLSKVILIFFSKKKTRLFEGKITRQHERQISSLPGPNEAFTRSKSII